MNVLTPMALAVGLWLAVNDPQGDAVTKERKSLQGMWKVVALEREGKQVPLKGSSRI